MPLAQSLFTGLTITQTGVDAGRVMQSTNDWIGVQINLSSVTGTTPSITFRVQWSFDNISWSEALPRDVIGTANQPVSVIQRIPIKGLYWRLAWDVTGTLPSFLCSANATV